MHDESPGDEGHWPMDKGEISFLTDLKNNVRDGRIRIAKTINHNLSKSHSLCTETCTITLF